MLSALSTAAAPASATALVPPPGRSPLAGLQSRQALENALHGRLWRGNSFSVSADPALPSGFAALDAELPGGGWPMRAAVELLTPQFGVLEWRLLAPALRGWWAGQAPPAVPPSPGRRQRAAAAPLRTLLLVNPPHMPHLPGLQALGLPSSALIWVSTATPAEALWATEQAVKSRVAVLAWLPEARPEQIRRLQVNALSSDAPLFLMRPESAARQSSAAPLRLVVQPGEGWGLAVHLLKRRGPAHEGWLALPATPGAVKPLLTAAAKRKGQQPSPAPAPSPVPANPPAERTDALARTVLHA